MRPAENIEKLIKNIDIDTNAGMDETVLEDVIRAFEKSKSQKSAAKEQNIWRIIMKSKITKLAAAAVIIIAFMLLTYLGNGTLDLTNTAFAQMTEAMKKMPWLHAMAEGIFSGKQERIEGWISFESKINATKLSSGEITYCHRDVLHKYDPESNTITISYVTNEEFEEIGSVWDYWETMMKQFREADSEISEEKSRYEGKETRVFKISSSPFGTPMEIKLTVDAEKNLPILINQKAFDANGDITTEANAYFDYPETGPKDIYDLGIPRTVQIIYEKRTILVKGQLVNKDGKQVKGFITTMFGKIQTDEKGEFLVSSNSQRKPIGIQVSYAFSKDKKLSRGFFWKYDDEPNTLEIVVEPLATITGRVVDKNGAGIGDVKPGIDVLLGGGMSGRVSKNEWLTTINKDGKFKFEGVPVGLPMRIFVGKPGYQGWLDLPELKAGETTEAGDIMLKPLSGYEDGGTEWTGVLSGQVINEKNKPMAGLRISCQPGGKFVETKTNRKGRYTLKGLPKGKKVRGSVYAKGYGHTRFETVINGNEVDIQLFPQGWDLLNKKAPGLFVRKWLNTEPLRLEQYHGKIVLLQLGVYLPYYLNHFELLEKIQKKYGSEVIEVIIVHQKLHAEYGVTERDITEFIKKHKINSPFGIDDSSDKVRDLAPRRLIGNGAMYSLYDVKATPALYLIDKKGILRISPTEDNLEQWIKRLLAE